jgi:single-strand DNA-binding protein
MSGVNIQILLGNVGKDPELRQTKSGKDVTSFSLATSKKIKGEEVTTWHRIVAWNKTAKVCAEYLSKGSPVHITGETQHREYEDDDGIKRQVTEVVAQNVTFIGQPKAQGASQGSSSNSGSPASSGGQSTGSGEPQEFEDSDIPF